MNEFAQRLLTWFDEYGRKDLPWQQDITPYRVWLSEIMLQQTQVATVIPYYARFLAAFPDISDLARAELDNVLHHWTGLGYYARARNLHKTARTVMDEYNGAMPLTVPELVALPGIGRSTAGAIVAICSGERASILDGNVKRVLARYFAISGWPGQSQVANALWEKAELLTPTSRVADYTQAIMDLGATLCTRSSPGCERCPFAGDCKAHGQDRIADYPGKKPRRTLPVRTTTLLVITNGNKELLLEKRPAQGLWGGLWSFPECDHDNLQHRLASLTGASASRVEPQPGEPFRHTFSHFHLDITPVHISLGKDAAVAVRDDGPIWYSLESPPEIGLTRPATKLIAAMKAEG